MAASLKKKDEEDKQLENKLQKCRKMPNGIQK